MEQDLKARIEEMRLRIEKLEHELVAEAKRTAEHKLRADKLDMQHKMQSRMRREALKKVVKLLGEKS